MRVSLGYFLLLFSLLHFMRIAFCPFLKAHIAIYLFFSL